MPNKTWGTPLNINEYIAVGNNDEIPKGQKAYVFAQQQSNAAVLSETKWLEMMDGDMAEVRNQIESRIKGAKVVYVAVSWTSAVRQRDYPTPNQYEYIVKGFRVEAIVENVSASLTGMEIVIIIMAVGFLVGIVTLLAITGWTTWRVISATEQIGPIATVGVGLIIIVLIIIALIVMFGGKIDVKGKHRRFRVGK